MMLLHKIFAMIYQKYPECLCFVMSGLYLTVNNRKGLSGAFTESVEGEMSVAMDHFLWRNGKFYWISINARTSPSVRVRRKGKLLCLGLRKCKVAVTR